tara:strand:- start:300 stop:758 length:459 start_codon:yes stop_codon:yes gene_type:complete
MKPRLYFDTSVFGGVYDNEFENETRQLFEMVERGEILCLYSEIVEIELVTAPQKVKAHFNRIKDDCKEFLEFSENAENLAIQYLEEKVVGKTSLDDCRHIATATIHKADYLVSWNFKHIVNVFRIQGYNAVNLKNGYKPLEIRSPKDIVSHG